jgi:hypothetical protein
MNGSVVSEYPSKNCHVTLDNTFHSNAAEKNLKKKVCEKGFYPNNTAAASAQKSMINCGYTPNTIVNITHMAIAAVKA